MIRYNHRRLNPTEFTTLMKRAELSVEDFIYLTGRRRDQLENFLTGTREGRKDYIPTMAEVLLLELAAHYKTRNKSVVDIMFGLVSENYDVGPLNRKEKANG